MTDIEKVSSAALDSLKAANFLTQENFEWLAENSEFSQEQYEKKQIWRTRTEMETSVLNDLKYPNNAAKYWQCNREYSVFLEQLTLLAYEYQDTLIDIEELEHKINNPEDDFQLKRDKVELQRKIYSKRNQELQSADRMRELRHWKELMDEYDDGSFDKMDVNNHQLVSYAQSDLQRVFMAESGQSQMTEGEKRNLYGRLGTSLKKASKEGSLPQIMSVIPEKAAKAIMPKFGFQLAEKT